MHASRPLAMKKHRYQEYISPLGVTPWAQACDKTEINKNFGHDMEHRYTDWVGEELESDPDDQSLPHPGTCSHSGSETPVSISLMRICVRLCCVLFFQAV